MRALKIAVLVMGVLLVVAGLMLVSALLYGITRGKEFAIGGYAAVLFIYPFIQFS